MASQTLVEAKKLINNQIVAGVAEDIISVNPLFDVLPFFGYSGQGLIVNRENVLGDAQVIAVDTTITAKAAATYTQQVFTATKIIGDAEMDSLVQAQSASAGVDQLAQEISSKAKSVGLKFGTGLFNGTGASPELNSLHSMIDASQYTTASAGQVLSFALLDELLDLVYVGGRNADFITMAPRTIRSYKILLRALGGASINEVITLPTGRTVIGYEGVPIFKSSEQSVVETANGAALAGGALSSVFAGCFDAGDMRSGLMGIHPASVPAGIEVVPVGQQEAKDSEIWRVRWMANAALTNRKALARLPSISN